MRHRLVHEMWDLLIVWPVLIGLTGAFAAMLIAIILQ
jgi:hypothetical protein